MDFLNQYIPDIPANYQQYLDFFPLLLVGIAASFFLTPIIGFLARKTDTIDYHYAKATQNNSKPSDQRRLKGKQPQALLGGLAVIIPLIVLMLINTGPSLDLIYFVVALIVLTVLGVIDDKYDVSGIAKFAVIAVAATIIVISPINLTHINNPINGTLDLTQHTIETTALGIPISIVLLGDLVLFGWIVLCVLATKFFSGTDGTSEGNSIVAAFTLFILSIRFLNHDAATISILFTGLLIGFLFFSFPTALVRCGSVGKSTYGFIIAVLSIMIGGKVAAALIILSLPLFDFTRVLIGRVRRHGLKEAVRVIFVTGDRTHIHHRLLDLGFTERHIFVFEFLASSVLGALALAYSGAYRGMILFGSISAVLLLYVVVKILHRRNGKKLEEKDDTPEAKYSY